MHKALAGRVLKPLSIEAVQLLLFTPHAAISVEAFQRSTQVCWFPSKSLRASPIKLFCRHFFLYMFKLEVIPLQFCFVDYCVPSDPITLSFWLAYSSKTSTLIFWGSSPHQFVQLVGKDSIAPLRWIPSLPSRCWAFKNVPWLWNLNPYCKHQLCKQLVTCKICCVLLGPFLLTGRIQLNTV